VSCFQWIYLPPSWRFASISNASPLTRGRLIFSGWQFEEAPRDPDTVREIEALSRWIDHWLNEWELLLIEQETGYYFGDEGDSGPAFVLNHADQAPPALPTFDDLRIDRRDIFLGVPALCAGGFSGTQPAREVSASRLPSLTRPALPLFLTFRDNAASAASVKDPLRLHAPQMIKQIDNSNGSAAMAQIVAVHTFRSRSETGPMFTNHVSF
jgi:hypothetical protein